MGRVGPACRRFVRYYRNRVFRAFFHAPPDNRLGRDRINVPDKPGQGRPQRSGTRGTLGIADTRNGRTPHGAVCARTAYESAMAGTRCSAHRWRVVT